MQKLKAIHFLRHEISNKFAKKESENFTTPKCASGKMRLPNKKGWDFVFDGTIWRARIFGAIAAGAILAPPAAWSAGFANVLKGKRGIWDSANFGLG